MKFLDTIRLAFGNNIVMGNCPDKVNLNALANKLLNQENDELDSFGLFDTNTANYNTYYPDVTAEDLSPKESEFVYPVFRALSEVIVHKNWNPVDFSEGKVLKNSMSLLKGQTVNADHEMAIGNAFGAVSDVSWQDSYKTKSGILVPAGINAKLKIDGKSHPRVARLIMMDPPAIHSTSVTIQFLWEKSHASLSEEEFFRKLGTFDAEGKMIRRIATDVKRYHEISLVSHGADPYAQKITDKGEINNPLFADVSYNSANPTKAPATKFFWFDFKTDVVNNSENPTIPANSNINDNNNSTVMNKQFLLALAMVMGLKNTVNGESVEYNEETITEDVVTNGVSTLVNTNTTQAAEVTRLSGEVTRLTENPPAPVGQEALTALQNQVNTFTDAFRAEVLKNYNVIAKGNPLEAVTGLIAKADYATLKALNTQYTTQLEEAFPLTCKDCGSENVNRASASQQEGSTEQNGGKTVEPTVSELQWKQTQKSILGMH
jgi:hypothetical protein